MSRYIDADELIEEVRRKRRYLFVFARCSNR